MIRQARERLANWWKPTLAIPVNVTEVKGPELMEPLGTPSLVGYRAHGVTVLVTPLGEIPIPAGCRATVLEVANAVAWIHGLPETTPRGFVW